MLVQKPTEEKLFANFVFSYEHFVVLRPREHLLSFTLIKTLLKKLSKTF